MSYYRRPFHLIEDLGMLPFNSQVYIVSDETYKSYQQKQAKDEIAVLEARAASYEKTAMAIREEIASIQKQAGLLTESKGETTDA